MAILTSLLSKVLSTRSLRNMFGSLCALMLDMVSTITRLVILSIMLDTDNVYCTASNARCQCCNMLAPPRSLRYWEAVALAQLSPRMRSRDDNSRVSTIVSHENLLSESAPPIYLWLLSMVRTSMKIWLCFLSSLRSANINWKVSLVKWGIRPTVPRVIPRWEIGSGPGDE